MCYCPVEFRIKNNISHYRKRKLWSQAELAQFLGVSKNTVSNLERGIHLPGLDLAMCLCIALECSLNDLYEFYHPKFHGDLTIKYKF